MTLDKGLSLMTLFCLKGHIQLQPRRSEVLGRGPQCADLGVTARPPAGGSRGRTGSGGQRGRQAVSWTAGRTRRRADHGDSHARPSPAARLLLAGSQCSPYRTFDNDSDLICSKVSEPAPTPRPPRSQRCLRTAFWVNVAFLRVSSRHRTGRTVGRGGRAGGGNQEAPAAAETGVTERH